MAGVLVVALAVRAAVAIASSLFTDGYLIPDEHLYVDLGRVVVNGGSPEQWYPGYGQSLYDATETFSAPLMVLFHVFGPSPVVGRMFAAAAGAAAAGITVVIGLRFLSTGFAVAAGLVVALTPSQVLFSSVVLREAHVWLALTLVALGALLLMSSDPRRMAGGAALAVAGLLALGFLRDQTMLAAAWALPLALLPSPRAWWLPRVATGVALAAIMPWFGATGIAGWQLVSSHAPGLAAERATLAVGANSAFGGATAPPPSAPDVGGTPPAGQSATTPAEAHAAPPTGGRVASAHGGPAATPREPAAAQAARSPAPSPQGPVAPSSAVRAPVTGGGEEGVEATLRDLPAGIVNVTLRPFPWQSTAGVSLLMARLETLGWYVLYALSAVGIIVSLRSSAARCALQFSVLVMGMLIGIAALTQGNLGTAFRHRDQLLWALALCSAAGLQWLIGEASSRRVSRATALEPASALAVAPAQLDPGLGMSGGGHRTG